MAKNPREGREPPTRVQALGRGYGGHHPEATHELLRAHGMTTIFGSPARPSVPTVADNAPGAEAFVCALRAHNTSRRDICSNRDELSAPQDT